MMAFSIYIHLYVLKNVNMFPFKRITFHLKCLIKQLSCKKTRKYCIFAYKILIMITHHCNLLYETHNSYISYQISK